MTSSDGKFTAIIEPEGVPYAEKKLGRCFNGTLVKLHGSEIILFII